MAQPSTGVIFDMDGVLVDSAAAHRRAWQTLGDEIGVPFTEAMFRRTFGQRNASIVPAWLGPITADRFAVLDARKESLYRDLVRQGLVRVYARVPDLLYDLRAVGARVAIASSGPRANVDLLIDVIGARAAVDATVAAEDVRHGKPDPEAFVQAAQRLGIVPPHCVVVEDSVHGIEGAKRAGMCAVAVLTSTARAELLSAGADLIVAEVGVLDPARLIGRAAARQ
jgi:beta-phosphoglucomutase